jgi:hypothetical protein
VPVIFFDWILTLTRQKDKHEDEGEDINDSGGSNVPTSLSMVEKFLQSKFMLFMGRISLSFYACHILISAYVGMFIYYCTHGQLSKEDEDFDYTVTFIPSWAILIVFPLSIVIGWLLTICVEAPMQKWLLQKLISSSDGDSRGGRVFRTERGGVQYNQLDVETPLPLPVPRDSVGPALQLSSVFDSSTFTSTASDSVEIRISKH